MINFNNIPDNVRTPDVFTEVDNSRALQNLVGNPHKVLIIGQKIVAGTAAYDTLYQLTKEGLEDGYFGPGSVLARMAAVFKENNKNTEVYGMCIGSGVGGTAASASIDFSTALAWNTVSVAGTFYLMVNGVKCYADIEVDMSGQAIASLVASMINDQSDLPVVAAVAAGSVRISAVCSGTLGNYINIRANYYTGQSTPPLFSADPIIVSMAGGATDPDLDDVWAVIDNEQFHYIIQPYWDATNLTSLEEELEDRFGPMIDKQGHGFVGYRGTQASCTTIGNSRNSPHNTILGAYDSPSAPEEWGAAIGAVAAEKLNNDPARPLQFLKLKGILAPPVENRFVQSERNTLLYDGIATWVCDSVGNVLIERCISTYQTNAYGLADPSYLDIETLATIGEIRYQYKSRMVQRYLLPRYKLADDTFNVPPGSYIVTPKTIKQEIIALFKELSDAGLVENIEDFVNNLIVERDTSDKNKVRVLLPPDLINQFRVLAGVIQFIL